MDFVHLHTHSAYSAMSGVPSLEDATALLLATPSPHATTPTLDSFHHGTGTAVREFSHEDTSKRVL